MTNDSVIILDGLSELLDMGFPVAEVSRFVRATLKLAQKVSYLMRSSLVAHNVEHIGARQHTARAEYRLRIN